MLSPWGFLLVTRQCGCSFSAHGLPCLCPQYVGTRSSLQGKGIGSQLMRKLEEADQKGEHQRGGDSAGHVWRCIFNGLQGVVWTVVHQPPPAPPTARMVSPGLTCYLEASSERNRRFYERLGFHVIRVLQVSRLQAPHVRMHNACMG